MQKILIVDDDPVMLRVASNIISKKYKVIGASSGAEAVKLFEIEKPDMVLSDLLMPEMNGYELHDTLQKKFSEPIPIVFMTADERDESESYGFEIGAADYIRKPLKADILLRRIENILNNRDKLQDLQQAADIDKMTGILNKSAATRELERICATASGALLMIDLDSFKPVNDIHGHATGDKLLIKFSKLLKSIMRESDLLGRMGGDEFIAFCQNLNSEKVIHEKTEYLNKNILAAAKKYMGENLNIPIGVSIGAVFVPAEGKNFAELFKKADKALYSVKQNGKHGYSIFSSAKIETPAQNNFSAIEKIFGERNLNNEAYFVGEEQFRAIYSFSIRLVNSLKKDFQIVQLTVDGEDENIFDALREVLKNNLRMTDCFTQAGKNQFLALLPETKAQELNFIEKRLLAKIAASKNLSQCKIIFESKSL